MAVFCELALQDNSGVWSLIRIVDRKTITAQGSSVPELMPPTPIDWTLFLTFKSGEARGSLPIKIEPVLPSQETLKPVIVSANFEGGNRGHNIVTKLNMTLTMPGVYWFRIYVEDEFVTQIPLEMIYSRLETPGPQSLPQQ